MERLTYRDPDQRARLTHEGQVIYCSTQATADTLAKYEELLIKKGVQFGSPVADSKPIDFVSENIIEISWIYKDMKSKGLLPHSEDSIDAKAAIIDLAKRFEAEYAGINWNESEKDYYEEIEKYAEEKLLDSYGSEHDFDELDEQICAAREAFKAYTDAHGYDFCDKDITELVDIYLDCQQWNGDVMLTGTTVTEMNDWIRHTSEVDRIAKENSEE